jgi:nucleotide-binding universal stress UspA family protein
LDRLVKPSRRAGIAAAIRMKLHPQFVTKNEPAAQGYKTILVHVEVGLESEQLLQSVVDFAYDLGAKVIGVGGCAPAYMGSISGVDWQIVVDQEQADARAAEARFREITNPLKGCEWSTDMRYPTDAVAEIAASADLVVVSSRHGPLDSTVDAGALALMAGIPVLAVPPGHTHIRSKRILIGWKNTREARRAVTDAMPLLCAAEHVLVVGVQADDRQPISGLEGITQRLCRHGFSADHLAIRKAPDDVAMDLIACAEEDVSDMIVTGAYGHSRLRELFFGGVTSGLLDNALLPVLFGH